MYNHIDRWDSMLKDLHIHIERGEYNRQWIEKFINRAVEMNIDEINLVEHSIRIKEFHPTFEQAKNYNLYQQRWFEGKKSQAHSIDEYLKLIEDIKNTNYPVKVNFGLEVCWFEQHFNLLSDLLSDNLFDYVLGSVHWIDNWTFNQRKYQWLGKNINNIYKRYYELNESLIESRLFDIVAHPDLIRCHSLYPDYDLTETYKSLCNKAKTYNVMLEMNTSKSLGINSEFLNVAKECSVVFATCSDAHRPEDVGRGIKEVTQLIY